jgi:cysteine dioxygenase
MESQVLPAALQPLVDRLMALDRPASLSELRLWLAEPDISREDLEPFVHFDEFCYARNPVVASHHFELLCICWKAGQSSLIHDHVGSACGVRVVLGELTETIFHVVGNGRARPGMVNNYRAGFVCSSFDRDVHQITNHQADGSELITLHIYSPPLAVMNSYTQSECAEDRNSALA